MIVVSFCSLLFNFINYVLYAEYLISFLYRLTDEYCLVNCEINSIVTVQSSWVYYLLIPESNNIKYEKERCLRVLR